MRGRGAAVTLALIALLAAPAVAVEEPEVLRIRAERLATAGRCEEALPLLARVRTLAPRDARAAHVAGLCQIRQRAFVDAAASLETARGLDASLADIDLHLGIARFHADDLDGAQAALADARRAKPAGSAELDLYEGLLALTRSRDREAAEALGRARVADPLGTAPIASYYEGLAWQRVEGAEEQERARKALEQARRESGDTPWAAAAEGALSEISRRRGLVVRRDVEGLQQAERPLGSYVGEGEELRRWIAFSIGGEWDDNVVLRGSGVPLPSDISDEDDVRLVWTAEAGAELFRTPDWAGGVVAAYYGSLHEDLSEFNSQYPTLTAWLDRRIAERTTARLQYDYGYAWVDADPYLHHHTLTPALFHSWSESVGTTRLFAELTWNNFHFGLPAGAPLGALNRDGFGTEFGIDHVLPITPHVALRGGYSYHRYSARGREYSFTAHQGRLGARFQLPARFVLDVLGSYAYRPYRHPSFFPDPGVVTAASVRRHENTLRADAILERPFTDWLTGSVRYSFLDNDSNRDVYDYDRNVVGVYLTFWLQP